MLYVGAAVLFVVVMALAVYGVFRKGPTSRCATLDHWRRAGVADRHAVRRCWCTRLPWATRSHRSAATNPLQLFLDCFGSDEPARARAARPAAAYSRGRQAVVVGSSLRTAGQRRTTSCSRTRVRIPMDRPVELVLSSSDVIHSFWVPSLAGKVDMIPGRTTRLRDADERASAGFAANARSIAVASMR